MINSFSNLRLQASDCMRCLVAVPLKADINKSLAMTRATAGNYYLSLQGLLVSANTIDLCIFFIKT